MVKIVMLGQTLRQMVDEPEIELDISAPTTVRALLEAHPEQLSAVTELLHKGELLITVNRKVGAADSKVGDGDTVKLTHNFNPTYDGAMWQNP